MSSRRPELRLLTGAAVALALLPRLAHRGLFLDGLTYASIARNLAEGRGTFWSPSYTATIYPQFHEHPPLALWLQSLLFRIVGDHWFVERLYCAAAAVAITVLIGWMWRAVYATHPLAQDEPTPLTLSLSKGERSLDWLPVLLWIVVPVVSWTIVNNLLETTVSVFDAAAVALVILASRRRTAAALGAGALSGACIAGAVLSKGPVGLFPLAAPALLAILPERRRGALSSFAGQLLTLIAIAALLASLPAARSSLTDYLTQQVAASLAGEREVSATHLTILVVLVTGVWLPMAVVGLIAAVAGGRPLPTTRDGQIAAAFTAIGLAGTLPIVASPKQGGHYLMPAVPFLAIGAAAIMRSSVSALAGLGDGDTLRRRAIAIGAAVVCAAAVAGAVLPALERDPDLVAELDRIDRDVPRDETLGLCPAANGEWILHAWFQRRWRDSLDASPGRHQWFLKTGPDAPDCPPRGCRAIDNSHGMLQLMRCTSGRQP